MDKSGITSLAAIQRLLWRVALLLQRCLCLVHLRTRAPSERRCSWVKRLHEGVLIGDCVTLHHAAAHDRLSAVRTDWPVVAAKKGFQALLA